VKPFRPVILSSLNDDEHNELPALQLRVTTVFAGNGACTACNNCGAYADDGSGLWRCTCGDRYGLHQDTGKEEKSAMQDAQLVCC
jgi:hypothetical protein